MIIDPVEHRLGVDARSSRRSRTAELPQRICQDQPRSSRFPPAPLNRSDRPTLASASRRARPRLFTLAPAIPCASGSDRRHGSDPTTRARLPRNRQHRRHRLEPGSVRADVITLGELPRDLVPDAARGRRSTNGLPTVNSMPTFGSACIKPAPALGLNRPRPNACLRGPLWAHDDQAWARLNGSAAI